MNHKTVTQKFRQKFVSLVNQSQKIVITSHISPDGDAVASSLALYHYLVSKYHNKQISIIQTGQPNPRFNTFAHFDKFEFVNDLVNYIEGAELIIFLDGSQYSRFSSEPNTLKKHQSKKICLDHHQSPADKFNLSLISSGFSSTTEIIYYLLNQKIKINSDLSQIFLLGILDDTGTFNYLKPHQLNVFDIAKRLLKISQVEIQDFKSRYETIPIRVFEVIQEFMKNTQFHQLGNDQSFQSSYISEKFVKDGNYDDNETSDASHIYVSHYLRGIDGYRWGLCLRPKNNGEISISLRSLPNSVSVRRIVEDMNIGGGHDRAAGGSLKNQTISAALETMLNWIGGHKLNNA